MKHSSEYLCRQNVQHPLWRHNVSEKERLLRPSHCSVSLSPPQLIISVVCKRGHNNALRQIDSSRCPKCDGTTVNGVTIRLLMTNVIRNVSFLTLSATTTSRNAQTQQLLTAGLQAPSCGLDKKTNRPAGWPFVGACSPSLPAKEFEIIYRPACML